MKTGLFVAACGIAAIATASVAQVPANIAEKVRATGQQMDPSIGSLYAPLFPKEPWPGLTQQLNIAYGSDPLQKLDVYAPEGAQGKKLPVLLFVHGGGFTRGTAKGAFYGYGGFGLDINFFRRFVATPNVAVGYFTPGTGVNLGAHTEFREGAEFDYRFDNMNRLGVGMYHMSNAGIGQHNPGVELVTVILTMPLPFR